MRQPAQPSSSDPVLLGKSFECRQAGTAPAGRRRGLQPGRAARRSRNSGDEAFARFDGRSSKGPT